MSQGENSKNVPTWWRCDTHGPGKMSAWGCPECVREMRNELQQLRSEAEALRQDAVRWRWLRAEHGRTDPICHLVWKRNGDRSSSGWVNTARLDASADLAIEAAGNSTLGQK